MSYAIQNFLMVEYRFFLTPRALYAIFLKYRDFFFFLRYKAFLFLLYKNMYYFINQYRNVFFFFFYRYIGKYYYLDLLQYKKQIYLSNLFKATWFLLMYNEYFRPATHLQRKGFCQPVLIQTPLLLFTVFLQYNANQTLFINQNVIYLFLFYLTSP